VDPKDLSLHQQPQSVQPEEFCTDLSIWDSPGFVDQAQDTLEFYESTLDFSDVSIAWISLSYS
jgi:hypothetical protein